MAASRRPYPAYRAAFWRGFISQTQKILKLRGLLREKGIDRAKITGAAASSANQYPAESTGEEVPVDDRLYLAVEIDGNVISGIEEGARGMQVIVFGDENMRRCVRDPAVIGIRQ